MGSIINLKNHISKSKTSELIYKSKLCRIRDEIEEDLYKKSLIENDELAVSLSSGRYSAMKLTELIGKEETLIFFNDCINTITKSKN